MHINNTVHMAKCHLAGKFKYLLDQATDVAALGRIPAALQASALVQAARYGQHLRCLPQVAEALLSQCLQDSVLIRPAAHTMLSGCQHAHPQTVPHCLL